MGRVLASMFVLIIIGLLSIAATTAQSHETEAFQGRLAYERRIDESTVEVVYYENGTYNTFPIHDTECYRVFTENAVIQSRFLAVSQRENPDSLTVYDMFNTEIVFQRAWESSWVPCSFRLFDGNIGVGIVDTQYEFAQLNTDGVILDTVTRGQPLPHGEPRTISPLNISYDDIAALLVQWIPDYPSGNGWYDEDYPYYLSSSSPYIIISVWLDENQNIVTADGTTRETIILDIVEGKVIEVLENAPILEPTSRFLSGIHSQDFLFSFTGEYLFYISDYIMIYDVTEDEYPVRIELDNSYSTSDVTRQIRWSPDGQYVAFTLFRANEESLGQFIGAMNVATSELYISESPYEVNVFLQTSHGFSVPYNRIWLSDELRLVWVNPEQELILYNVASDTTSVLDENVVWIIGS